MTYERVQKASSWSSQPQEKTSPFARRPFTVPAQAPTQQEIENEAIQKNKLEAFGLELQAKHGTITPEGQERLTVLQAKMDAFWQQRRESIERRGGNILQRLLNQGGTRTNEPPPMIQTKLTIGEPGDQYEQEADQVAARVVNQINAPAPQQSAMGESVQREEQPEEEKLMTKPQEGIVQRQILMNGKAIEKENLASQILTGTAQKLGFDLDFAKYSAEVEDLRRDSNESENIDTIRQDTTGSEIVRIFNRVSKQSLTVASAPKYIKPVKSSEKKPKGETQPIATEKKKKNLEDLKSEGLIHEVENSNSNFLYPWGGTSKIEEHLRKIYPEQRVSKKVLDSSLRQLTVGQLTFTEESNPFPASKNIDLDHKQEQAINKLKADYKINDPQASEFLSTLFKINAAKGMQTKGIVRMITGFFETFIAELEDEKVPLDQALAELQQNGMYREIVRSGEANDVIRSLFNMSGVGKVEGTPELVEIADLLAQNTDILRSPTWLGARTDEEYAGLIGEYISHKEIQNLMPNSPTEEMVEGDQVMQLHSVHFIGDLYKKSEQEPDKTNTDVCSELDLMSVVAHSNKSFTCFAFGNTKVTKSSAAAAADQQNKIAQEALSSFIFKKRFNPAKENEAVVTKIYGFVIPSNERIELVNIKLDSAPERHTIGAKQAPHGYSKFLSLTYDQIHTIAFLLRERVSKKH